MSSYPLRGGDYWLSAHGQIIAFEMKWSLGDLLASFGVVGEHAGPRLVVEVNKMLETADVAIVMIPALRDRGDGVIDGAYSEWRYSSAKGILSTLSLYGVIVDEWDGDLAVRLGQWYYNIQKGEHHWAKQGGRPRVVTIDKRYAEAIWCLCSARGVGPEQAKRLLGQYGNVYEVLSAVKRDQGAVIRKVKGLKRTAVEALSALVTKDWSEE